MKNNLKVLISFVAILALTLCITVTAIANEPPEYTGTVAELDRLVGAAEETEGAEDAVLALEEVAKYLEENPINPEAEGYLATYEGYAEIALDTALELCREVDPSAGTAECGVEINRLKAFAARHPLADAPDGYGEFADALATLTEEHAKARQAQRDGIADHINLDEFGWSTVAELDYESNSTGFSTSQIRPENSATAKVGLDFGADGENNYITLRHDGRVSGQCYFGYRPTGATDGFVIEFDVTTFGELPDVKTSIETGSVNHPSGTKKYPKYLDIMSNGDIAIADGTVVLENAIVRGQWLHIAIAFDAASFTYSLFIEDELVATYSSQVDGYGFIPALVRVGSANTKGEISFDNTVIYYGTTVRDRKKLDDMTKDELFLFYTKYLSDESNNAGSRKTAYEAADALLGRYWESGEGTGGEYLTEDEALRAAVDKHLAFDYEEVYAEYLELNLGKYKALAEKLLSFERNPETLLSRQSAAESIDTFISKITSKSGSVDILMNDEYKALLADVNEAKDLIEKDFDIKDFVQKMYRFTEATTIEALQRYYSAARELAEGGIDLSVILTDKGNGETEPAVKEGYEAFAEAYERYLQAKDELAEEFKDYYSEVIIGCVNIIKEYDTEQEWLENYDLINSYLLIIREILGSDTKEYNPDYVGLIGALKVYKPINDYFYQRLQESHAEIMEEMLDKYSGSKSYAERLGVCSFIKGYLAKNDVDSDNELIEPLLIRYELYCEEVEREESLYAETLVQNSNYFINIVNDMMTLNSYAEMKPLFDEAYALYFALDASVPGAEEAIDSFDAVYDTVSLIEEHSRGLIISAALLADAYGDEAVFALLIECCYYTEKADLGYAGVREAMAVYNSEYSKYCGKINQANTEIGEAVHTVGSLRASSGEGIIAVFIKKISR